MTSKIKKISEWKNLKEMIVGQDAVRKLKSFEDAKSLKDIQNSNSKSLLHVAAKYTVYDVCKYLIDIGLDVNLKYKKNNFTPLCYALNSNDKKMHRIIELFIHCGADLSWTNIVLGSKSQILFKNNKIVEKLGLALKDREGGSKAAAQYLLSVGWTLDNIAHLQDSDITNYAGEISDPRLRQKCKNLQKAVSEENILKVKKALEQVAQHKIVTSRALSHAMDIKSPKSLIIIKLLLDYGAPPEGFFYNEPMPPLQTAFLNRLVDISWLLMDHGAQLGNCTVNALLYLKSTVRFLTFFKDIVDALDEIDADAEELEEYEDLEEFQEVKDEPQDEEFEEVAEDELAGNNPNEEEVEEEEEYFSSDDDDESQEDEDDEDDGDSDFVLDDGDEEDIELSDSEEEEEKKQDGKTNKKVDVHNWIRLLIEHKGVRKNIELIRTIPLKNAPFLPFRRAITRLSMEYRLIVNHLTGEDEEPHTQYHQKCNEELKKIKNYKIEFVTVWDLLLKSIDEMIPLTKNDSLMNKIRSESFSNEFPCYSKTLQFKVSKALKKRLLIDHSISVLKKCLPSSIGSCDLILKKVVFYIGVPNLLCLE